MADFHSLQPVFRPMWSELAVCRRVVDNSSAELSTSCG
nr:MAG TPA_asm: hypothetical protein [Caudoviricetes sp.]